jgi:hypothetical protein
MDQDESGQSPPREPEPHPSEKTQDESDEASRREPVISVHHLTFLAAVVALVVSVGTYLLQRNDTIEIATLQRDEANTIAKLQREQAATIAGLQRDNAITIAKLQGEQAKILADRQHEDASKIVETLRVGIGRWEVVGQVITLDGKEVSIPKGPIQIQFWTPSAMTKQTADAKEWEKFDSDDRLVEFGDKLIGARIVRGYRRYDVIGEGRGSRKVGAWWVSSNSADFKLDDFLKFYQEFWQPGEDAVYMEVQTIASGYR